MSDRFSTEEEGDMILSKLRIYEADGIGCSSCVTHFVKVSSLREFRITADSDTDLTLRLEWSMDGDKVDSYTEYPIFADICLSKQVEVCLQFVRFHVLESKSEIQNCRLKIFAFSPDDKIVAHKEQPKKGLFSSVNFSPKMSPKSRKKDKQKDDDRIPFNIYRGSLLVGKNARELMVLPRGNEGDVLMILNGDPQWVSLVTLFTRYDEIQKKERENSVRFSGENSDSAVRQCFPEASSSGFSSYGIYSGYNDSNFSLSAPSVPIKRSQSDLKDKSIHLKLNEIQAEITIEDDEKKSDICDEVNGIYDISVSKSNRCTNGQGSLRGSIGRQRANSKPLPPLPSFSDGGVAIPPPLSPENYPKSPQSPQSLQSPQSSQSSQFSQPSQPSQPSQSSQPSESPQTKTQPVKSSHSRKSSESPFRFVGGVLSGRKSPPPAFRD